MNFWLACNAVAMKIHSRTKAWKIRNRKISERGTKSVQLHQNTYRSILYGANSMISCWSQSFVLGNFCFNFLNVCWCSYLPIQFLGVTANQFEIDIMNSILYFTSYGSFGEFIKYRKERMLRGVSFCKPKWQFVRYCLQ